MLLKFFLELAIGSALPVTGLRIMVPFFLVTHPELPLWFTLGSAMIGYMIPAFFFLWFLPKLTIWLNAHSAGRIKTAVHWVYQRAHAKHSEKFYRWGELALIILIAIPLPGTGVWTGSLLAFLFNVPYWRAIGIIFIGVILDTALVTALATGVIAGLKLL